MSRRDPAQIKVAAMSSAIGSVPALPTDVWCSIFEQRATRMWFESKCLPQIKAILHCVVESCNKPTCRRPFVDQPPECHQTMTLRIHQDKKVTYKWGTVHCGEGIGHLVANRTSLFVERTWLETKFQVRFKMAFLWVIQENNLLASPSCSRLDDTCACPPCQGKTMVVKAFGQCALSCPRIVRPKRLRSVISSNQLKTAA